MTSVAVNGEAATWVSLLPKLLQIWKRETYFRRVWPCRCKTGPCDRDASEADLPGGSWSTCPFGVIRGPQFQALLLLSECARIGPLSDWPDGYAAWVSWGLVQLRRLETP